MASAAACVASAQTDFHLKKKKKKLFFGVQNIKWPFYFFVSVVNVIKVCKDFHLTRMN